VSSLALPLAVLAELAEPRSTIALAETLDRDQVDVEQAISRLEEAGLVEREGFGAKTELVPVGPDLPRWAGQARSAMSGDAWQALFGEQRAQLAYVLDAVPRLELAACVLDEHVEAIRGDAFDLVEVGVLATEPLRLDPAIAGLADLLAAIDALRAREWVQARTPEGKVVWHLGPEIVFRADPPVNDPEVAYGGPSAFDDHGLAWDGPEDLYVRTRRTLDASDAILQSLLVYPDDEDVREACRELFASEPTPTFDEKAEIYGLGDDARDLGEAAV
jgi:hypothetical protein